MPSLRSLTDPDYDRCWVCGCLLADAGGEPTKIRESHHVLPQSLGGKNGPQVPLCIGDHDLMHLIATKKIAQTSYAPFLPKDPVQSDHLEYLSSVIHRAHVKLNMDPNKRIALGVMVSRASAAQVQALCDFHRLTRPQLLLKLLSEEYGRVFPSRSS